VTEELVAGARFADHYELSGMVTLALAGDDPDLEPGVESRPRPWALHLFDVFHVNRYVDADPE
jgi:hypothetical protein